MNILYLPCHSILEYDELNLFEELGYDYFSLGSYINPQHPHDIKRPPLKGPYHEHLASIFQAHSRDRLHPEIVEWADVVIVMHIPEFIENNWEVFKAAMKKGTRVIWRTIGQSVASVEQRLQPYRDQGLEVVRYSPKENTIPHYIGEDAMIRFYKDPEEFKGWKGEDLELITFAQSMKSRGEYCSFDVFAQVANGLNAHVYGPNNDDAGKLNGGMLEYEDLKAKMRDARVYFYTGTHPASYTLNFMEAMMTGIPIVAIGERWGESPIFGQHGYEVPDIIENGTNGYVANDIKELREAVDLLLNDKRQAEVIGTYGRKTAIDLFGKAKIRAQWKEYLER